jgi:hypothetical protein
LLLPIPGDATLRGAEFFAQWLVLDPLGPSGVAASRGARVQVY